MGKGMIERKMLIIKGNRNLFDKCLLKIQILKLKPLEAKPGKRNPFKHKVLKVWPGLKNSTKPTAIIGGRECREIETFETLKM